MPGGSGCDDFSFDVFGSLYCTTDPFLTVVRMDPDGSTEILLTAADGLDGPTATAFGVHGTDRFNLYITNARLPLLLDGAPPVADAPAPQRAGRAAQPIKPPLSPQSSGVANSRLLPAGSRK